MGSKSFKNTFRYSFFSVPSLFGIDKLDKVTETERNANSNITTNETGWDRVVRMLSPDEFGNLSVELVSALQTSCMSLIAGAIYGGVIFSRQAYMDFMRNNEATKFRTHLEAKAKLQEKVMISFGRGAFRWSWRLALFTGSIFTVSAAIQAYRNKYGIFEYASAGGITGALFRFNLGPKGWVSGGIVGAVLGSIAGGSYIGLLKLTGISMAEHRYWQYQWKTSRDEMIRKGMKKQAQDIELAISEIHNLEVGDAGKDISVLDKLENVKDKHNANSKNK